MEISTEYSFKLKFQQNTDCLMPNMMTLCAKHFACSDEHLQEKKNTEKIVVIVFVCNKFEHKRTRYIRLAKTKSTNEETYSNADFNFDSQ